MIEELRIVLSKFRETELRIMNFKELEQKFERLEVRELFNEETCWSRCSEIIPIVFANNEDNIIEQITDFLVIMQIPAAHNLNFG